MAAMRATRRQVLGTGALLLAAGCTAAPAPAPAPAPVDPDDALRSAATARERVLLEAYDAALLAASSLAARLAPIRAEHAEHLAVLTGPAPSDPPGTSTPGSTPDGAAPVPATPAIPATPATPADVADVLAGLVRAEQAAAAGHGGAVGAASRPLAALLAVLAASEASHLVVLT